MHVNRAFVRVAVLILFNCGLVSAQTQDDFALGVTQVKQGNFAEAVITLDRTLLRMNEESTDPQRESQAHLYLGMAYAGLAQIERAKEEFRKVLGRAPELKLCEEGLDPAAIELFEAVRAATAAPPSTSAAAPSATSAPEPKVAEMPGPSERPQPSKDSSHKRKLLIGAGAGVVAAAVAVGAVALRENHPPTVSVAFSPEGTAITAVTRMLFNAVARDSDGDALSYDWAFGDGNTASGPSASHVFGAEGTYTVSVTVRDEHAGIVKESATVQARGISGTYRPNNEDLRDYQILQSGAVVSGLVDPNDLAVPFEGALTDPREINLEYLFDDEGRICHESITGTFDPSLSRITGNYSCTLCRMCRKNGTFPVILTKQ